MKFLFLHPMAFKTSYHSVLNEPVIVLDVLDDMDGVLDDVWTSVHCLKQDLGDQCHQCSK